MTTEEQIRCLQQEIMRARSALPSGGQRDIVVYINHAVGTEYTHSLIQQIEKALDDALGSVGFTRSTTTKGDICELVYWQFAQALEALSWAGDNERIDQ